MGCGRGARGHPSPECGLLLRKRASAESSPAEAQPPHIRRSSRWPTRKPVMKRRTPALMKTLSGPIRFSILVVVLGAIVLFGIMEWTDYAVRIAVFAGVMVALFFSVRTAIGDPFCVREGELLREAQLAQETDRNMLRALIDNVPDFMYVKDLEGRFVVANAHVARVAGVRNRGRVAGQDRLRFLPSRDGRRLLRRRARRDSFGAASVQPRRESHRPRGQRVLHPHHQGAGAGRTWRGDRDRRPGPRHHRAQEDGGCAS